MYIHKFVASQQCMLVKEEKKNDEMFGWQLR